MTGPVVVDAILRAEQVAIFATGAVVWLANGGPPLLLIPAWLLVDLSMVGYLGGPRLGSITYNAAHNLVLPLALLGLAGGAAPAGWYWSRRRSSCPRRPGSGARLRPEAADRLP